MAGVAELCGESVECFFDVGATGDLDVGRVTVEVQAAYNEIVEVSQPSKYFVPLCLVLSTCLLRVGGE